LHNRTIALSVLFSVFAIGLLGGQQSYAIEYNVIDEDCGNTDGLDSLVWNAIDSRCDANDQVIITSDDTLNIDFGITIYSDDLIQNNGTINNSGTIWDDGGDFKNLNFGTINNSGTITDDGSFENNHIFNNLVDATFTTSSNTSSDGIIVNDGIIEILDGGFYMQPGSIVTNNFQITSYQDFNTSGEITNAEGATITFSDGYVTIQDLIDNFGTINMNTDGEISGTLKPHSSTGT